jgi:drug/metabolite transporter (DMT)-like permease
MKEEIWSPLLIAIIASATQAFGISLQRKAHVQNASSRNPLWLTGFLIYTISNLIASTCTIGYLPIVILAPVGAIGLVFNAVFAKWVLGDPFTKRTVLGKAIVLFLGKYILIYISFFRYGNDCIRSRICCRVWYSS